MNNAPITREGRRAPHDPGRLRDKRIRAGLSQVRLAKETGLSTSLISALECGDSGASPESLTLIATALDCELADLMPEESS